MNFFSRMKSLNKSGAVEEFDAALADLEAQGRSEQTTIAKLKEDLGAAVIRGDESAVARIQAEKAEAVNRLELIPIARSEIERRKAEAEAAKTEAELLATMSAANAANDHRRAALKRLHRLFAEASELLAAEAVAAKTVREANVKATAAGRRDLAIEVVEAEAARRRAKAYAELATSVSPGPVDFDLGSVRLPGYQPAVEFDVGRQFMVQPLSLIE